MEDHLCRIGPVYGVDGAWVTASLAGQDQDQRLVAFLPLRGLWPKSHLRRNGQAILKLDKPCLNSWILLKSWTLSLKDLKNLLSLMFLLDEMGLLMFLLEEVVILRPSDVFDGGCSHSEELDGGCSHSEDLDV